MFSSSLSLKAQGSKKADSVVLSEGQQIQDLGTADVFVQSVVEKADVCAREIRQGIIISQGRISQFLFIYSANSVRSIHNREGHLCHSFYQFKS